MRLDVLIFGGGAAGLWCLDRFRRAGYSAIVLESRALGSGQTIQAQGIIHGGGKYALRGVRDFAAAQATKEMPELWRRCLAGDMEPRLNGTRILSERCYLWLPRGSLVASMQSWGFMPMLAQSGLLATRPQKVEPAAWPEALRGSATAVYALSEQVISTGTFLQSLAAKHREFIFLYDPLAMRFAGGEVEIGGSSLSPRAIVLAAGEGNAALLHNAGIDGDLMQRRPLCMVLLKGALPPLFGHCIAGGKTSLTVTAAAEGIWQVGGEIAERLAREENDERAQTEALKEIRHGLPAVDLSTVEIALYRAVRAEAATADQRRPSGVHISQVTPRITLAWPTKLALVPVLAEEVFVSVSKKLKKPESNNPDAPPGWPKPALARYPWEEAEWFPAR
jgi:glycerol-3-phosphate dehydrogenase